MPGVSLLHQALCLIIAEHVIIVLKAVLAWAIPDIPSEIRDSVAKSQQEQRELVRREEHRKLQALVIAEDTAKLTTSSTSSSMKSTTNTSSSSSIANPPVKSGKAKSTFFKK